MYFFGFTKSRKCVICRQIGNDYIRYNFRDIDEEGIVFNCARLEIKLKDIKIAKRNRIVCQDCDENIKDLIIFKNRVAFLHNIDIPEGLLIPNMCSICYDYNPLSLSGIFDDLTTRNITLIDYTFEINFSRIIENMKLTCDDCRGCLTFFCNLHINLQRAYPQLTALAVDVDEVKSSNVSRKLSSFVSCIIPATDGSGKEETNEDIEHTRTVSGGSLRRIPSFSKNLDCLENLYQRGSVMETQRGRITPGQQSDNISYISTLDLIVDDDLSSGSRSTTNQQATEQDNIFSKLKRVFSKKSKAKNPTATRRGESKKRTDEGEGDDKENFDTLRVHCENEHREPKEEDNRSESSSRLRRPPLSLSQSSQDYISCLSLMEANATENQDTELSGSRGTTTQQTSEQDNTFSKLKRVFSKKSKAKNPKSTATRRGQSKKRKDEGEGEGDDKENFDNDFHCENEHREAKQENIRSDSSSSLHRTPLSLSQSSQDYMSCLSLTEAYATENEDTGKFSKLKRLFSKKGKDSNPKLITPKPHLKKGIEEKSSKGKKRKCKAE